MIAAIAVISRRRSGSGVDGWDSFSDGAYAQAPKSTTNATDAAKDAAANAGDAVKDAAAKAAMR